MPTIPDSLLTVLRTRPFWAKVLAGRGVDLRPQGADLVCRCPLPDHDDRTASFHVSEKADGSVGHCFGCDWSGNLFQLVQRLDGGDFVAAVATVAAAGGVAFDAACYRAPAKPRTSPSTPRPAAPAAAGSGALRPAQPAPESGPLDPDATGAVLDDQVLAFAHAQLIVPDSPGQAFLVKRGVWDAALAARFRLGYLPRGLLGKRLTAQRLDKRRVAGARLRAALTAQGWVNGETGHGTLDGRVLVPITAADDGRLVQCYGRTVHKLGHGAPDHKHLGRPVAGCWNAVDLVDGNGAAILCEAALDALSFAVAGHRHVTFTLGTGSLHDDHLAALRAGQARDVFVAFDNDPAGNQGAQLVAERLIAAGFTAYRVELPPGHDVNDVARAAGAAAPEALAQLLRAAQWWGGAPRVAVAGPVVAPVPPPAAATGAALPAGTAPIDDPADPPRSPEPSPAPDDLAVRLIGGDGLDATRGTRRWRVRGLARCASAVSLRVNLRVQVSDAWHQDHLDLTSHRARQAFVQAATAEVPAAADLLQADLGRLLLACEETVEGRLARDRQRGGETPVTDGGNDPLGSAAAAAAELSAAERDAALDLLRDPRLLDRIVADLTTAGLVGEDMNKLCCYVAAVSRLLPSPSRPLAVLVQSSSAAGKSTLVDAVLAFLPEEARLQLTSISPQALSFFGRDDLKHRTLSIAEDDGLNEAAYLLKLLQSEGRISRATTTKDPTTGQPVTTLFEVEGPVQLFLTTTSAAIDDELRNRCLVLAVDEAAAQTAAIQDLQRQAQTVAHIAAAAQRQAVQALHRNAQRLLRPVAVVNPYADQLRFPSHATRLRRDHAKYLALINAVTLLHQYQRPRQSVPLADGSSLAFIAVTRADLAAANRLAGVVLGRTVDDLPGPSRTLLAGCAALATAKAARTGVAAATIRFSRREIIAHTGLSYDQLRRQLPPLIDHEYLGEFPGGARNVRWYQILDAGDPSGAGDSLPGLLAVEDLVEPADTAACPATTPTTDLPLGLQFGGSLGQSGGSVAGGPRQTESSVSSCSDSTCSVAPASLAVWRGDLLEQGAACTVRPVGGSQVQIAANANANANGNADADAAAG